ncbi:MAG: NAD(P)-dependent oxidoreductase [Dehalococcoidia bacterium]|nr:NAD(P)-dependent oxidoreductase [Dehalococcoidia bacterium]
MTRAGEQPENRPKPNVDRKARLQIPPRRPAKQPPEARLDNWNEVYSLFDPETAKFEANRCIQCPAAPCQKACPVHNDIPGALALLEVGDFTGGANVFRATSELPEMCGRLCPQERLCEGHCVVGKHALPVAIGKLESFVTEWQQANATIDIEKAPSTGKRVAVVGSGPAGVGCAERLARAGHAVTIIEAWPEPGGVLLYGIPDFKLNKPAVARTFDHLRALGIEVRCGVRVGVDLPFEQLRADFDAVFLGYGASEGSRLGIQGEDAPGVLKATEFLVRANLEADQLTPGLRDQLPAFNNVVVIGGGDTSMDCVRSARRLGAERVTLIYRRTEREMQGRVEERQHASEEGAQFEYLTAPLEVLLDAAGRVRGLRCQRMRLGALDDTGRARPEPQPGSEFDIPADAIVTAIGYNLDPAWNETAPDLVRDRWNRLVVDPETMATNIEGVFAGGDNVNGADLVVTALAHGHTAADTIHAYLVGLPS